MPIICKSIFSKLFFADIFRDFSISPSYSFVNSGKAFLNNLTSHLIKFGSFCNIIYATLLIYTFRYDIMV